jgi:hypothetical protein
MVSNLIILAVVNFVFILVGITFGVLAMKGKLDVKYHRIIAGLILILSLINLYFAFR